MCFLSRGLCLLRSTRLSPAGLQATSVLTCATIPPTSPIGSCTGRALPLTASSATKCRTAHGWTLTSSLRGTQTGKTRLSGLYRAGSPARFGVSLTSRETRPRKTVSSARSAVHTPLRTQSRPSCLTSTLRVKTAAIPTRAARPPAALLSMRTVALRTATTAQTRLAASSAMRSTSFAFTCSVRTTKGNQRTPRRTTFLPTRICVSGLRPTARAL